jgi:high-affinity Fe2+/Pb2+ permease
LRIQSALKWAAAAVAFGALTLLGAGFFALTGSSMPSLTFTIVQGLVWVGIGIYLMIKARRRKAPFEAEHGPDAGKQEPMRSLNPLVELARIV